MIGVLSFFRVVRGQLFLLVFPLFESSLFLSAFIPFIPVPKCLSQLYKLLISDAFVVPLREKLSFMFET